MRNFPAILLLAVVVNMLLFHDTCSGQLDSARLPLVLPHFQDEYSYVSTANPDEWKKLSAGLHVSFATTDEAYFSNEVPRLNVNMAWNLTGWKGERLNAMVLIWSPDTLQQVRFMINDLKDGSGHILSKENMHLQMVRYVLSNYPYNATNLTCDEGAINKAWLMPDRLENFNRFDLPGQTMRPVWLTFNIPTTAVAGLYKGVMEVKTEKYITYLELTIKVQHQQLPLPKDWSFRLDLWQNPWVIAHYYQVKPWSEEHKALLRKHLKLYADAGGKYITTYAVHSPWADATYRVDESMIEWIKTGNAKWKFDYRIFDEYVQLAMEAGVNKAITIYTPIPWGNRFRFLDER